MGDLIAGRATLSCYFCGRSQNEVEALFAGMRAYVCSLCVELCGEILVEERRRKQEAEAAEMVERMESNLELGGKTAEQVFEQANALLAEHETRVADERRSEEGSDG